MQGRAVLLLKGTERHPLPPVTGNVLHSSDLMPQAHALHSCVRVHTRVTFFVELDIVLDGISSLKQKSIMLRDN